MAESCKIKKKTSNQKKRLHTDSELPEFEVINAVISDKENVNLKKEWLILHRTKKGTK